MTLVNRLDKRVSIWTQPGEPDSYGQESGGKEEVCQVWAAIEPLRGREFFSAFTEQSEVTTRIRIRYREGIDRTMIVKYKSMEFEIMHIINPVLGKKELQLMCKERQ